LMGIIKHSYLVIGTCVLFKNNAERIRRYFISLEKSFAVHFLKSSKRAFVFF
jgi:hypothetical protein